MFSFFFFWEIRNSSLFVEEFSNSNIPNELFGPRKIALNSHYPTIPRQTYSAAAGCQYRVVAARRQLSYHRGIPKKTLYFGLCDCVRWEADTTV
ncbi:hypothetical protein Y032_0198g1619 [Ancylostoma ceylanicum]|uniref:Uncharacterized protein n=1 Tax=Ancylostoma ceylanicum TaxID=53326 RepID=A0A016SNY4_9BILA|nr:hypothetical protein Y032_0198g1619 [Ancylostoma ceylanicum]